MPPRQHGNDQSYQKSIEVRSFEHPENESIAGYPYWRSCERIAETDYDISLWVGMALVCTHILRGVTVRVSARCVPVLH